MLRRRSNATTRPASSSGCCCGAARHSAALAPKRMSWAPTAVQRSRSSPVPRTTTGTSYAGSSASCAAPQAGGSHPRRHQPQPAARGIRNHLRQRRDRQPHSAARQRRSIPPGHRHGGEHAHAAHRRHRLMGEDRAAARSPQRRDRADGTAFDSAAREETRDFSARSKWQQLTAHRRADIRGHPAGNETERRCARRNDRIWSRGQARSRSSCCGGTYLFAQTLTRPFAAKGLRPSALPRKRFVANAIARRGSAS
jgi:hypothetical protein